MLTFLKTNIYTIIIIAVLVIIVALVIKSLVKDKKSGGSCTGNCSSCASGCSYSAGAVNVKTTVAIDGMMCGMCESHINDVIRRNFDIIKVSSSYKKGVTTIVSKKRLDNNFIKKVIGETGYKVKEINIELCE